MRKFYHSKNEKTALQVEWFIVAALFIFTILTFWCIIDAVFPTPAVSTSSDIVSLRIEFNQKFGSDRTTVREAEHYKVVSP